MIQKIFIVQFPDNMKSIADAFEVSINQEIQNRIKEISPNGFISKSIEVKI